MPRLVIIDGDERHRRRMASALTSAGFDTLEASGSVEGLLLVLDSGPNAILLAEDMPPLQAADLLVILSRVSNAPIIVIGTGGEPEEVATLEAGADSYLQRGDGLRLLAARVNALLRRFRSSANPGPGLAPPVPISLTATERRLMTCLSKHDGRPVPLGDLRLEVWGGSVGADNVKYHLRQLREKLESQPCGLKLLSIRGVGYRLVPAEAMGRGGEDSAPGKKAIGRAGRQAGAA
jgi:DNA-binding response OmpR family regulator